MRPIHVFLLLLTLGAADVIGETNGLPLQGGSPALELQTAREVHLADFLPAQQGLPAADQTASVVPLSDVGRKVVILGRLGVPMGTTVRITGRVELRKGSDFTVETVNATNRLTAIIVEGLGTWPEGTRLTLEGHESGKISLLAYMGHSLCFGAPQLGWQAIQTTFYPIRILEPVEASVSDWSLISEPDIKDIEAMMAQAFQKINPSRKGTPAATAKHKMAGKWVPSSIALGCSIALVLGGLVHIGRRKTQGWTLLSLGIVACMWVSLRIVRGVSCDTLRSMTLAHIDHYATLLAGMAIALGSMMVIGEIRARLHRTDRGKE